MRRLHFAAAVLCALALASCGSSPKPAPAAAEAKPAAPVVPPEVQQAAETSLGSETTVLTWGDLARNGHQQLLAINELKTTPKGAVPGILFNRAAVIENDGNTWKEVFRCDEHLENPKGYLAGTPLSPVNGWRLQYEQHEDTGLVMYFTPLEQPAGGHVVTIGVRWNPRVARYQALDRTFEKFLGETSSLEPVQSQMQR